MAVERTIFDLKRGDRFTVPALPDVPTLTFDHLDGMYSYCTTDDGQVCHLATWTPVRLVPAGGGEKKVVNAPPPMILPINYLTASQSTRTAAREEYVRQQNGLCYFCKTPLSQAPPQPKPLNMKLFPKGFLKAPIHLHHSHVTDMTIGAVHGYCNGYLWQYLGE